MGDNWPFILTALALIGVVFLFRMYRKLQSQAQAHKRAMVWIARKHDLALVLEDDSKVSMKLTGVIEGIQVTLFSALRHREKGLSPITQVTAVASNEDGTEVHLVEDGFVGEEDVLGRLVSQAVRDAQAQS